VAYLNGISTLHHLRRLIRVLFIVELGLTGTASTALAFDRIVVFGDSLSDSGNAGRFSNGPVWVEQLARQLGIMLTPSQAGGLNFAVGGARLDPDSGPHNLRAQVDLYLGMPPPKGRVLHIVFGGGNDILAAIGTAHAGEMVDIAVTSLTSIVSNLAGHGATDILLPNLPDVGMSPEVRARGSRAVAEAGSLSDRFNVQAERALQAVNGVRLHRLDVHAMGERAKVDPAAFGFVDVTTPCQHLATCEGYLFWDNVHPTTRAHERLAERALQILPSR
jgi:phospholipase/lecithinase/hemolysin